MEGLQLLWCEEVKTPECSACSVLYPRVLSVQCSVSQSAQRPVFCIPECSACSVLYPRVLSVQCSVSQSAQRAVFCIPEALLLYPESVVALPLKSLQIRSDQNFNQSKPQSIVMKLNIMKFNLPGQFLSSAFFCFYSFPLNVK
ncbi:hypothetical protein COCON_G00113500 [Conger conger]|uniref:Uncharacterized protein n=1 Tax=Conger conger TaxID=82655 RepID=A0A9Q1DFH4_CONCO|nr:hypothetical protein COCON_G00113500 [Conger conger]